MIVLHASLYIDGFCLIDRKTEVDVYIIYNVFIWILSGMTLNFSNIYVRCAIYKVFEQLADKGETSIKRNGI